MKKSLCVLLLLLATTAVVCLAQQNAKPGKSVKDRQAASVKKLLDRAEVARKTGDLPKAIKLYKQVILASPGEMKAYDGLGDAIYHSELMRLKAEAQAADAAAEKPAEDTAVKPAGDSTAKPPAKPTLETLAWAALATKKVEYYRGLAAAHPKVIAYRFELLMAESSLASSEHKVDFGRQRAELEKLVAEDPAFAPAVAQLGGILGTFGEKEKSLELLTKACEIDPTNEVYGFIRTYAYSTGDPVEFRRQVEDFAVHFPKSDIVWAMLAEVAENLQSPEERIALMERAATYPRSFAMGKLLLLYARTDLRKAADVAQKKLDQAGQNQDEYLKKLASYYGQLAHAQELLRSGQFAEAQAALDKAIPEEGNEANDHPKVVLTAELLAAQGEAPDAYKFLLDYRHTIADPDLSALAVKIGVQLGKSEPQVNEEIIVADIARARLLDDFEVESMQPGSKSHLSEFRGKYVLLNFWAPT